MVKAVWGAGQISGESGDLRRSDYSWVRRGSAKSPVRSARKKADQLIIRGRNGSRDGIDGASQVTPGVVAVHDRAFIGRRCASNRAKPGPSLAVQGIAGIGRCFAPAVGELGKFPHRLIAA